MTNSKSELETTIAKLKSDFAQERQRHEVETERRIAEAVEASKRQIWEDIKTILKLHHDLEQERYKNRRLLETKTKLRGNLQELQTEVFENGRLRKLLEEKSSECTALSGEYLDTLKAFQEQTAELRDIESYYIVTHERYLSFKELSCEFSLKIESLEEDKKGLLRANSELCKEKERLMATNCNVVKERDDIFAVLQKLGEKLVTLDSESVEQILGTLTDFQHSETHRNLTARPNIR